VLCFDQDPGLLDLGLHCAQTGLEPVHAGLKLPKAFTDLGELPVEVLLELWIHGVGLRASFWAADHRNTKNRLRGRG
jgi:hypothetical protein